MTKRYNSSRNRKVKRNSRSNIIATFMFAASFAIIFGLGYLYFMAKNQVDEIDSATFCHKGEPTAVTAILIDHTDNINATQKAALEIRLWDIAKSIPKNSVIRVYSVGGVAKQVLVPDIVLCNPGNGETVSSITGNKVLATKRYEQKFKEPITKILDRIVSGGTAEESPIMKSLQSVAVTSFVGEDKNISRKKLILVSDLLEHTSAFSVYKGVPDFESYKNTSNWSSVKADLTGVDVEIFFLRREGEERLQNVKLRDFWTKFIENQGASVTHFLPVEG